MSGTVGDEDKADKKPLAVRAKRAAKRKRTSGRRSHVDGLTKEWERTIERDERWREAVEKWRRARAEWRANGRTGKEPVDPWEDTNWVALGCCARARVVFRTMAAQTGARSLEDFRDLLRCAAMAAGTLDGRAGSTGRGLFTAFKEILLVLSNAVEVTPAELKDGDEDRERPPAPRREGIDTALLETLHGPARRALAAASSESLRMDGQRTGIRFTDPKTGRLVIANAGRELVRALQRNLARGLRGDDLADAIAANAVWVNGAFSEYRNIRWKDPAGLRDRDTPRTRLHRWANDPRIDFDAATDFEALALSLLRAIGMNPKAARNAVSAAEDMRTRRKKGSG